MLLLLSTLGGFERWKNYKISRRQQFQSQSTIFRLKHTSPHFKIKKPATAPDYMSTQKKSFATIALVEKFGQKMF